MAREQLGFVLQQLRLLAGPGPAEKLSDAELLEQFIALREEAAFEILVRRHGPLVWSACRRVLESEHDAEDVFQATFLVLARRANSIRKHQSVASWLYGVAYRLAQKLRSEQSRRRSHEKESVLRPPADPALEAAARDSARVVLEEVERLPEKYRAAVVLRYLAGRTNAEAAAELGWPVGTVKTRLARALQLLEKRLSRRGLSLSVGLGAAFLGQSQANAFLPAKLLAITAGAAIRFLSGSTALQISPKAARLALEAVRAVSLNRLRNVALLLAAGILFAGGGILARPLWAVLSPEAERVEPLLPAERGALRPLPARIPELAPDVGGAPLPPNAVARLGSAAFLHGWPTVTVVFAPDGKTLLSGSPFEPIRLWKADTGQELQRFSGHESHVRQGDFSFALSRDGQLVAARSHADSQVHLWDLNTGRELARFAPERKGGFSAVGFSPNGEVIARWADQTGRSGICVWDRAGKRIRDIAGPGAGQVTAISGDGRTFVTVDAPVRRRPVENLDDPQYIGPKFIYETPLITLHIWDSATGQKLASREYESESGLRPDCIAFSPDGSAILCQAREGISLRDVRSGAERLPLKIHGWPCALSPNGQILAVVEDGHKGTVVLWDLARKKELHRLLRAGNSGLAFSADGTRLTLAGLDCRVHIWDVASGTELSKAAGHESSVIALAFTADATRLVSMDSESRVWDVAKQEELFLSPAREQGLRFEGLSPDGQAVLLRHANGDRSLESPLRLWPSRKLSMSDEARGPGNRFLSDGRTLVFDEGLKVKLCDTATGQWRDLSPLKLRYPDYPILAAAVLPGDTLAMLLYGTTVGERLLLWNTVTGQNYLEREATGERRSLPLREVTFSPDGSTWAALDSLGHLGLWETGTGKRLLDGKCPEGRIYRLGFSSTGRYLAVGGGWGSGFLCLWDTVTGQEVRRLERLSGEVYALAFAPDGRQLATGFSNGALLVWDLAALGANPKTPAREHGPERVQQLWSDLAEKGFRGYRAAWSLVDNAGQTIPLLSNRLRPVQEADPAHVRRLLADLESRQAATRDSAIAELERMGAEAEPEARRALSAESSAELRARLEALLKELPGKTQFPPAGERLRRVRAVSVLERIGTQEAEDLLEVLASGLPAAEQTLHARAALARLRARHRGSLWTGE